MVIQVALGGLVIGDPPYHPGLVACYHLLRLDGFPRLGQLLLGFHRLLFGRFGIGQLLLSILDILFGSSLWK